MMGRLRRTGRSGPALAAGLGGLILSVVSGMALGGKAVVVADFVRATGRMPAGWDLAETVGTADVALVPDGDGQVLRIRSEASSFSLQREVDIDLKQTPYLVWQWKVTELPRGGDFRQRATDDQAAQLLVLFTWEWFRKEVITYIWDSTSPQGTTVVAPTPAVQPFLTMKAVVVRSGEAEKGTWTTETRNVAEDYRALFAREPEKVIGVRIQINSQHTQSRAESYWRSVVFTAAP
jgi:hypothetical protein